MDKTNECDGRDLKLVLHFEPIDGFHMSDVDFLAKFFVYPNRTIVVQKAEMKKIDDDNYCAVLTKEQLRRLGKGKLMWYGMADIPDSDFDDGFRTDDTDILCTGVTLT